MHGFPNELAAANRNFALGGLVVVLLRLYGIDPRADLSRPELEPWGYVPPVRVSARVLGTVSPTATDLVWQTYPECPANNTLVVRDALTAVTNVRGTAGAPRASLIYCIYLGGPTLSSSFPPFPHARTARQYRGCAGAQLPERERGQQLHALPPGRHAPHDPHALRQHTGRLLPPRLREPPPGLPQGQRPHRGRAGAPARDARGPGRRALRGGPGGGCVDVWV